ncbi:MAG: alpha/beta hydrolase [Alphaproteobacteria bacterium]|nr:alpha/beta hydrolase [Alphaproteobacteria bacterium]
METIPRTARDRSAHGSVWSDLQGVAFTQGYVAVEGIRTRYLRAGTPGRPALIFLHGTGGHAEAYCRNLAAHALHFDTFSIDMLGHGYTDKPDYDYTVPLYVRHVAGFMDAMGLPRASLSGESLGGWVASHFAVTHRDRTEQLVLNTAGGDRIDPVALEKVRQSTLAAVDEANWDKVKARLQWLMFDGTDVHDDLVASRLRIYRDPAMRTGIRRIVSMHVPEARQRFALTPAQWGSITAPTLVLWTSHDPTAKVEVGRALADMIPGARFVVMQDCGHWPQFEDAATFNRVHLDFLLGRG